jgi:hypothetical protein
MQTATIAHHFVEINKAETANGNVLDVWSRASCNSLPAGPLDASGPLSTRILIEQLTEEALG